MTVPLFWIESDIPSTETGVEPVKDYSVPVTVTGEHLREIEKKKKSSDFNQSNLGAGVTFLQIQGEK